MLVRLLDAGESRRFDSRHGDVVVSPGDEGINDLIEVSLAEGKCEARRRCRKLFAPVAKGSID
jgi:hypothetical protein